MARVLVIDDEQMICRFVSRALEAHGDSVVTAASGEEALGTLEDRDFDLVVLDLLLPGLDGFGVLEEMVRQDPRRPVVVLSAVDDVESRVRCLKAGAADFLAKPFATAELLARIDARLSQPAARPPSGWLFAGGVRLDVRRRVLHDGPRSSVLSQREFVLLEHLMRRTGAVCTREELLEAVWGMAFDPGSNVVDVYVARLRSKLQREHIETVRGVGYRFCA